MECNRMFFNTSKWEHNVFFSTNMGCIVQIDNSYFDKQTSFPPGDISFPMLQLNSIPMICEN